MNFFSLLKRKLIFILKDKENIDKHNFKKSTSLESLFLYYKTDKAQKYKDGQGHGFSKYYTKHINKFRTNSYTITILSADTHSFFNRLYRLQQLI